MKAVKEILGSGNRPPRTVIGGQENVQGKSVNFLQANFCTHNLQETACLLPYLLFLGGRKLTALLLRKIFDLGHGEIRMVILGGRCR